MMNILVSLSALLLACTGFFAYDQITYRESLTRTLSAQAQIVGSNSIAALLFNDPQSASNTLSALKNFPNIASAGILTADRQPFAQYSQEAGDQFRNVPVLPPTQSESYVFKSNHLILVRKILSEGKVEGFVYIRANLAEINTRLWRYAFISAVVLVLSLFFALAVSSTFRKSLARPIVELAETARGVSRKKDYSVRVVPTGEGDELAVLIDSFNEMLKEIQVRDDALQAAHDQLEQRVSERTRELLAANRELEAFSYSVSHDLRGPLDALNGFSYVLLQQYGDKLDANGKEVVNHIRASGKRMTDLIDDLLNLSRVTTRIMQVEKVDLSAIVYSVAEELRRSDPKREVDFVVSDSLEARGDVGLLRIVFENLLRNSWKYTSRHDKAKIEFGAEQRNGDVVYYVRDDGAGFDPRSTDRLFHPFQRLHPKAEFPGNGIGLVTVQRIIHRHRGEVWAQGEVEKGATFYFTLNSEEFAA